MWTDARAQGRPDIKKSWHHNEKTAAERGYGHAWVKLRNQVKARDNGLCQPCMRQGLVRLGSEVDHIKPKCEGGTDDLQNLQFICDQCHMAKTAAEAARAQGRREVRIIGLDGFPT